MRRAIVTTLAVVTLLASTVSSVGAASATKMVGINVVLNRPVSNAILADLATYGKVRDVVREIKVVTLQARLSSLRAIRKEAYVAAASPDAKRVGKPVPSTPFDGNGAGLSTWDLDAINVTDISASTTGPGRIRRHRACTSRCSTPGCSTSWRQYFPQERIATRVRASPSAAAAARSATSPVAAEQVGARPELARHARDQHHPRLQPGRDADQRRRRRWRPSSRSRC